ncbi:MAG TPA: response regulator, partial [Candidatus Binatia bacterium]|nr:response regulator [Candidatus Binatia bacterium]
KAEKLILIVEDEDALAEVLADALETEGYKVQVCDNGEDGLKVALEKNPDLILLDMLMPKKNGMTMLTELRKSQKPPISPVIFFTNLNQLDKIASAVEEGAEGYMIKAETSLEEIVKKVDEFFEKKTKK